LPLLDQGAGTIIHKCKIQQEKQRKNRELSIMRCPVEYKEKDRKNRIIDSYLFYNAGEGGQEKVPFEIKPGKVR